MIIAGILYAVIASYVCVVIANYINAKNISKGITVKKEEKNPLYSLWSEAVQFENWEKAEELEIDGKRPKFYRTKEVPKKWTDDGMSVMWVLSPFVWPLLLPVLAAYYVGIMGSKLVLQVVKSAEYIGKELGNPKGNT